MWGGAPLKDVLYSYCDQHSVELDIIDRTGHRPAYGIGVAPGAAGLDKAIFQVHLYGQISLEKIFDPTAKMKPESIPDLLHPVKARIFDRKTVQIIPHSASKVSCGLTVYGKEMLDAQLNREDRQASLAQPLRVSVNTAAEEAYS